AVRQDLMEKYGMTELKNWDDYKQYMLTVAEKETPESGIYALASSGDNNELWDVYRQQTNTMLALDSNYMDFIYEYKEGELPKAEDIKFVYEYEPFRQYAYDMKEMADAGCWSRSALTNTVTDDDAFGALQGASIAWNASVFTYMEQAEKAEGVECMAYDLTTDNLVNAEAYSNNDMAITAGSENPERAAMVLDLLKFDTTLNRLLLLGVEGVHYDIDDEGNYTELDKSSDYSALGISAAWATKNGDLTEAGTPERELVITDAWKERVVSNPTITFVFDDASVKPYEDAVISILNDYVPMLELGLVDDVDKTMDEMIQKCYDAGLQNVMDEFTSQYNTWLETR
ncbi:MAG: ABC transporter substrate-binding protein, partial [bacterium]|nr:ABC transporter substrate-binding protein [bacterium]